MDTTMVLLAAPSHSTNQHCVRYAANLCSLYHATCHAEAMSLMHTLAMRLHHGTPSHLYSIPILACMHSFSPVCTCSRMGTGYLVVPPIPIPLQLLCPMQCAISRAHVHRLLPCL